MAARTRSKVQSCTLKELLAAVEKDRFKRTQLKDIHSSQYATEVWEYIVANNLVGDRHPDGSPFSTIEKQQNKDLITKFASRFWIEGAPASTVKGFQFSIDTGDARPVRTAPFKMGEFDTVKLRHHIDREVAAGRLYQTQPGDHVEWSSPVFVVDDANKGVQGRLVCDYRRLNAVTRRNPYPLPLISTILRSFHDKSYFTTMDLVDGFFQVELDPVAQNKAAIVTPFGVYKWRVLPLGVANGPPDFQQIMDFCKDKGLSPIDHASAVHLGEDETTDFARIYADDLTVASRTLQGMLLYLTEIFKLGIDYGLVWKLKKLRLCMLEVKTLGVVVSRIGKRPDPEKTHQLRHWPLPANLDAIRSLVMFASYLRDYIPDFPILTAPLRKYLKKYAQFSAFASDDLAHTAFKRLIASIEHDSCLTWPDFDAALDGSSPFLLFVDASDYAVGATLAQVPPDGGSPRPIAIYSMALKGPELNWFTWKKELFAVVWACRKVNDYIKGFRIKILMDHKNNLFLGSVTPSAKTLTGQLFRWSLELSEVNAEIIHICGSKNVLADAPSRAPAVSSISHQEVRTDQELAELDQNTAPELGYEALARFLVPTTLADHSVFHKPSLSWTSQDKDLQRCHRIQHTSLPLPPSDSGMLPSAFGQVQRSDPLLLPRFRVLSVADTTASSKENLSKVQAEFPDATPAQVRELLNTTLGLFALFDGTLYRVQQYRDAHRLSLLVVIPDAEYRPATPLLRAIGFKEFLMYETHHGAMVGGHQGGDVTARLLLKRFWWKGLTKQVRLYCSSCTDCQAAKPAHTLSGPYNPAAPTRPFTVFEFDLVGPIVPVTPRGHTYIFTGRCLFSRYDVLEPMPDKSAITVAEILVRRVILVFGCPEIFRSDNGSEFLNEILIELCRILSITKEFGSAYHPQAQGSCEVSHRTLNYLLSILSRRFPQNWDIHLPQIQFILRTTPMLNSDITPFEVLHGYTPAFPMDIITAPRTSIGLTPNAYVNQLVNALKQIHAVVANVTAEQQESRVDSASKSHHVLDVGDFVMLKRPPAQLRPQDSSQSPVSARLLPRRAGPFVVAERKGGSSYILADVNTGSTDLGIVQPVPIDQLITFNLPPFEHPLIPPTARRIKVWVKDTDGDLLPYMGTMVKVGVYGTVWVQWDNGDPSEWIDLDKERHRFFAPGEDEALE
jgi:hypothetical protein